MVKHTLDMVKNKVSKKSEQRNCTHVIFHTKSDSKRMKYTILLVYWPASEE